MKTFPLLLICGAACLLTFGTLVARAELEVSASAQIHSSSDFYTPLSGCGTWVEIGSYGRCWHPVGAPEGWRPYCDGEWIWTNCGWYWASDEPWAWACYHYGWWVYDDVYGWLWVPGIEWAPCWVCWRYGGGYIGWAPLPPPRAFRSYHPINAAFVFVNNKHFGDRIRPSVVVANSPGIFKQTKFTSNIEHAQREVAGAGARKVVVNEGPGLDAIQKTTSRQFKAVDISEAVRRPAPEPSAPPNPARVENQKPGNNGSPNPMKDQKGPPSAGQNPNGHPQSPGPMPGNPGQNQGNGHGQGHDHGEF